MKNCGIKFKHLNSRAPIEKSREAIEQILLILVLMIERMINNCDLK